MGDAPQDKHKRWPTPHAGAVVRGASAAAWPLVLVITVEGAALVAAAWPLLPLLTSSGPLFRSAYAPAPALAPALVPLLLLPASPLSPSAALPGGREAAQGPLCSHESHFATTWRADLPCTGLPVIVLCIRLQAAEAGRAARGLPVNTKLCPQSETMRAIMLEDSPYSPH